jgi:hypothetical protein
MRAREFLAEITLDVPDQMVTVQLPLSALKAGSEGDSAAIINPGKRAGDDGKYKWSPPLQQHLDTTKDAVGPSNDEITVADAESAESQDPADQEADPISSFKKTLAALLSRPPSVLG